MLEKLAMQEILASQEILALIQGKLVFKVTRMETVHTRIKNARLEKGLSMEKVAELLGLKSWQTVQQWENGSTAPTRKRMPLVAEILGKSSDYLLNGNEAENGEHALIHMVDAKASAGKGRIVYSTDTSKMLMFRRDYLAKNDAKPEDVLAFEVAGDSMVDMHIVDGSVVLANRNKKEPISKRVYVIWLDGELYVKQLIKVDGLWYARSRNINRMPDYPDIQIDIDDRIVGRAFWCGFGL